MTTCPNDGVFDTQTTFSCFSAAQTSKPNNVWTRVVDLIPLQEYQQSLASQSQPSAGEGHSEDVDAMQDDVESYDNDVDQEYSNSQQQENTSNTVGEQAHANASSTGAPAASMGEDLYDLFE
jgi:hypothetical protein